MKDLKRNITNQKFNNMKEKEEEKKSEEEVLVDDNKKKTDEGKHRRYGSGGTGMPFVDKRAENSKLKKEGK